MIFADKLIKLRKKNNWSQEELAELVNVSRQSVSKWEGAQSIPDYDKMIKLSQLFNVSIDYLLKDELIEEEKNESFTPDTEQKPIRRITMETANNYLSVKALTAKRIALGSFLCILSPICLFVLGAASENPSLNLSENAAGGLGIIALLLFVAAAVAIFISSGSKTSAYEYIEKELFETEYGVSGMVKERKEQYKGSYTKCNILGSIICIVAFIPLFIGVMINENDDFFIVLMLAIALVIAGIGVLFFVNSGIIWSSFEKLLQEGDYTKQKKQRHSITAAVSSSYWLIATAIYLASSFTKNNWEITWIIWAIAGVLYPAVLTVINAIENKKD